MTVSTIKTVAHPLADGNPPSWASAWGHDPFGPFAEFVFRGQESTATQRMRWLPPNNFRMGSPEDESGRRDNEGPPHDVRLTEGFWLFDTPCTQALWQAVTGDNPSRFVDPQRPVERVSWEDACQFLEQLRPLFLPDTLTLPTEAQWEYACRSGSDGPIHGLPDGATVSTDGAPLDQIAWYSNNSGDDFDLAEHSRGTRKVGQKQPNPFGLFDMLGNVWEWCRDGRREYTTDLQVDPVGPAGAGRVVRGGSWSYSARRARSAYRYAVRPSGRDHFLGFRPALVHSKAGKTGDVAVSGGV